MLLSDIIDDQFCPLSLLCGGSAFNPRLILRAVIQKCIHIESSLLTFPPMFAIKHLFDHILHISGSIWASDSNDDGSEFGCFDVGKSRLQKGELE